LEKDLNNKAICYVTMVSRDYLTWFWLDYFTNKERTNEYISNKIKTKKYNDCYDSVVKLKQDYKLTEKFEKIEKINSKTIKEQSDKVIYSVKQASEYFRLSTSANLHVKPLILYYGMISLSKALMESTFIFRNIKNQHGLGGNHDYKKCIVMPNGFFPRFSACNFYSVGDPSFVNTTAYNNILILIYEKISLTFEDLIFPLSYYLPQGNSLYRKSPDMYTKVFGHYSQKYAIDPISCYLMIMYLFSNFVRYKPVEWIRIIEGNDEDYPKIDWILKPLLERAVLDYPALILDEFRRLSEGDGP